MTKQEALDKIKELEEYIKKMDEEVGFEDDDIFLLSKDEYRKYESKIPSIGSCSWWLRSQGNFENSVTAVVHDTFYSMGIHHDISDIGVRPALKLHIANTCALSEGNILDCGRFPWICIDKDKSLFVAEVPICFRRFDGVDGDYETSEIRKFLKEWWENR